MSGPETHEITMKKDIDLELRDNIQQDIELDLRPQFDAGNVSKRSSRSNVPKQEIDGGWIGWMTVLGAWLILFGTMGYVYSFGVYQDYYTRVFLKGQSPSKISWMGSFQLALPFALGPVAGKLFAAGHARLAIAFGSLLYVFSLFMLSLAKEGQFYQVFLSQGLGMGLGSGFLFTPTTAIVGVHFKRRRSLAIGTALTGMSLGAVAFPILINQLIPKTGFANTVRVSGYIILGCVIVGNSMIRMPTTVAKKAASVDVASFFRDPVWLLFLFTSFTALLSIYFPTFYIQLYGVEHNLDNTLSFYSIAILNGVGTVGRVLGSYLADAYGVWNMIILGCIGSATTIWVILAIHDSASLIVISCLYGFFSGAWLAVGISALVSLSRTPDEVGARVGIAYAFMSIGAIISAPIQGALLSERFQWVRPVAFSGTLMVVATVTSTMIRMMLSKRKNSQFV